MNKEEICFVRQGDIIQVTDESEKAEMWYGCTMTVDEVKPWGVQAGMKIPGQGFTFLRLKWEQFERVGVGYFMFGAGGGKNESDGKD